VAQKQIPITSWQVDRFEVSIQRVRDLSEGRLKRDPDVPKIKAEAQIIKPPQFQVIQPKIRGSMKFHKWCVNKAAAMGMTMDAFKKWRSMQMTTKYYQKKKWGTV
jgi:hypothetical protein